jgi:hypothetical protein
MKKYFLVAALSALASVLIYAHAMPQKSSPGLEPFTPTRIDWLVTALEANLRQEVTKEKNYTLDITASDPETVLIQVRYLPTVDRKDMNMAIDTARKITNMRAKIYGWDSWIKITEEVEPAN